MMKLTKWIIPLVLLFGATSLKAQTLHGIICSDTEDADIGSSCAKDLQMMHVFMGSVAQAIGYEYSDHVFAGEDCSSRNAVEAVRSLQVGAKDIVFFYYTGHGARSTGDSSPFPQLKFNDAMYPVYRIADQIASKSPRLSITISDACNSFIPGLSAKGVSGGSTYVTKSSNELYRRLFLQPQGQIRITSSKVGQNSSATSIGGKFTIALLSAFERAEQSAAPSWEGVLSAAKLDVERPNADGGGGHTPYWELKLAQSSISSSSSATPSTTVAPSVNQSASSSSSVGQGTSLDKLLAKVASDDEDEGYRLRLSKQVLRKHFASPNSIVEVIGRNGTTLLARERAAQFMERISTSFKLQGFVILEAKCNTQGLVEHLRVHEIYRK